MSILKEYGIENNIFSITFDNASNNTSAIEFFKNQIKNYMGGLLYHVSCVCHIINLIVQDSLKFFEQHIHKIRSAIVYIKSFSMRYEQFRKYCQSIGWKSRKFPLHTTHRWNTTYLMLESKKKNIITDFISNSKEVLFYQMIGIWHFP